VLYGRLAGKGGKGGSELEELALSICSSSLYDIDESISRIGICSTLQLMFK
jgi:hypothetical protein